MEVIEEKERSDINVIHANIEFNGVRSSYYKEIMQEMPDAREEEKDLALKFLNPRPNENILETGAGSGFFSVPIASAISPGTLVATDPSSEQLEDLSEQKIENIHILQYGADNLPIGTIFLTENHFDAIWSGGSFHHVLNKTDAFKNYYRLLKPNGRLIIADVYSGSDLAKHFDYEVAKYCVTGHEVSFLTKEFADSLCYIAGFEKPKFYDAKIQWKFKTKKDLGKFIYKIHAMVKTTPDACFENAEKILGIEYKNGFFCLNWPLTVLITYKR